MTIQLMPVEAERFDGWRAATRSRLIRLRRESGALVGDDAVEQTDAVFDQLLADGHRTETSSILSISDGGEDIGTIWLASQGGLLFILDLTFVAVPSARAQDELYRALVTMGREHGVRRLSISLLAGDAQGRAFIDGRGFACASIQMLLEPLPDRVDESGIVLARMTAERFPSFASTSEAAFAADLVASGRYTDDDARAESRRQMTLELPDGVDTTGQLLFTASVDGDEVGVLWLGVRARDGRPHVFILDIEVSEAHRRRGYGRAMMHAAEREARELGADSIGLHAFGFNDGAVRLYESLGYRRVEERFLREI